MQDPKKADEINLELLYEATHNELAALKIKYDRLLAAAKKVAESIDEGPHLGALLDAIGEAEGDEKVKKDRIVSPVIDCGGVGHYGPEIEPPHEFTWGEAEGDEKKESNDA